MSMYDKLNEQQKAAVYQTQGPVLILAGAGSGKTSVLTHRVAYLIDEVGVNPYNILAITFTNKAAGEMRERVDKLVGFGSDQIHVSTFHSMCVRILRRYIDKLGYDNNFTIYDADDQKQVVRDVCKKLEIDTKRLKERTILNEISSNKDELVTPESYLLQSMSDFSKKQIAQAYIEYQAMLRKNNALDFDDLIMKTVELFKTCPDVLANYQNRWQYIMVDEYQDTNTAQFELIKLLASASRNLCVVGDDDQSIYKFRGANIRNILDFERYYPEAKVIKLEQNYRSVQNILEAANSVIRNNSERKDKSLWSKKEAGELIHYRAFDTALEEAQYVTSEISKSVSKGESSYSDNAVLYRTNAQSRLIEEQFVKLGVKYIIVGGINFYSRREIKDLLAYLKTIDNGQDDLAAKRIINVPKRGIGATSITKVQNAADEHGVSFFEALGHLEWTDIKGTTADKMHGFQMMIYRLKAIAEEFGPAKALTEVLDATDYITQMDVDSDEEAAERIENIEELISKVTTYEEEHDDATLSGLLEEIALVADIDNVEDGDNVTLLMTIHSAKGLEFKNVFLVGMEDGLFPSNMSIGEGDIELEEERRLAYVAITRAKERLTISSARARMINGTTQYYPVSRFVHEIPKKLFDIAPVKTRSYSDGYYDADTSSYGGYRKYDNYHDDEDSGFSGFRRSNYSNDSDSYGSSGFSRKSSGYSDNSSGYSGYSRSGYGDSGSSSGYSGFKRAADTSSESSYSGFSRPKAYYTPKKTPDEEKPFIAKAQAFSNLTKGSDLVNASAGDDLKKGDRVRHIKFGDGTIVNIVKEPRDSKVTVQFDTAGQKIMYASFAKLKKI